MYSPSRFINNNDSTTRCILLPPSIESSRLLLIAHTISRMALKIRRPLTSSWSSSSSQRKVGDVAVGCVRARQSKTVICSRRSRARRVRCKASSNNEMCRDKVSSPVVREAMEGERVFKITFVGDNNEQTVVDCPEVRLEHNAYTLSFIAHSFLVTTAARRRVSGTHFPPTLTSPEIHVCHTHTYIHTHIERHHHDWVFVLVVVCARLCSICTY